MTMVHYAEDGSVPTFALADIAAERQRQIAVEGWTMAHDDEHDDGQMADAAGVYAINAGAGWEPNDFAYDNDGEAVCPARWPWSAGWWKPAGRRRDLVRAAALIVAEIERLDRADAASLPVSPAGYEGEAGVNPDSTNQKDQPHDQ